MAADIPYFPMNNGAKMPAVGMGCWLGLNGGMDAAEEMCKNALKCGYRHIDTASGYENEQYVGNAIRDSGIPRSQIFLTTKLWCRNFSRVHAAFEDSLRALGVDYIDLYLMHWPLALDENGNPIPFEQHPNFVDVWADMEKLLDTGKVRSIGVSNFSIKNLEILLKHAKVIPANNQVEVHPCLPQHKLKEYCDEKGILLSAYSPLGQGNPLFFDDPDFAKIAESHAVTPAQVAMSYLVERGIPAIAKSANVNRMKANISIVRLTPEEVETISNIHKKPSMHRSLLQAHHTSVGVSFGWTYEELGWPMTAGGFVKE
ncbi:Aldo/keto reductase [Trametes coccinea BRFM310]|uniref:Aldo/keto reductase n=1 Tax=Trametes coccinea (strain BRFM310) TaxID=1353009 RepID=A0A1Y2IW69_TRAC3|nr:Aldo/keto reductase [Trametes coccinea BRFM310]